MKAKVKLRRTLISEKVFEIDVLNEWKNDDQMIKDMVVDTYGVNPNEWNHDDVIDSKLEKIGDIIVTNTPKFYVLVIGCEGEVATETIVDIDPDKFYKKIADWIMDNDRLELQWKSDLYTRIKEDLESYYENGQYELMFQTFFYDERKQDSYYWATVDKQQERENVEQQERSNAEQSDKIHIASSGRNLTVAFWRDSQASGREDAYNSGAVRRLDVCGYYSAVETMEAIKKTADAFEHEGFDDLRFDLSHGRWGGAPFRNPAGESIELTDLSFEEASDIIDSTHGAW